MEKLQHIKLLLTDCDGVLTDAGVYYGENGEVLKKFNIRDGMGVERPDALRRHRACRRQVAEAEVLRAVELVLETVEEARLDGRQKACPMRGIRRRPAIRWVAGVQMQDGRPCLGRTNRRARDVLGGDRQIGRHRGRMDRAGDGAGNDDL